MAERMTLRAAKRSKMTRSRVMCPSAAPTQGGGGDTHTHEAVGGGAGARKRMPSRMERIVLSILGLTLVMWFLRLGIRPVDYADAWLHLRIGTFLNEGGSFDSLPDPWTPWAERVYVPTQWLPERIGAWLFSIAGLPAVALMRTFTMLALLVALVWMCRQMAEPFPAAIATTVAFVGSSGAHTERPQLAAMVLLTVTVAGWWMTLNDGRPRWWIVPLTWLHATVHGSWLVSIVVGLLFVVVGLLDEPTQWRHRYRLALVPLLSIVAAALTPLGPQLLLSPFQVTGAVSRFVQEWQAVQTSHPLFLVAGTLLLLITALWVWSPARVPPSRFLILLAAAVCIVWSGRTIAIGVILASGLLAEALQRNRAHSSTPRLGRFEVGLWSVIVVAISTISMIIAPSVAQAPVATPVALSDSVATLNDKDLLFADHGLSAWVMWENPNTQLVFDLRSEIYTATHIEGFVDAIAARPGWEAFVHQTGATHALLRKDQPLTDALYRSGWNSISSTDDFVFLARGSR